MGSENFKEKKVTALIALQFFYEFYGHKLILQKIAESMMVCMESLMSDI